MTSPALLGVKSIGGVTPSLPAFAKPEAALELVLVAVEPDRQQDYKRDSDDKKKDALRHGHASKYITVAGRILLCSATSDPPAESRKRRKGSSRCNAGSDVAGRSPDRSGTRGASAEAGYSRREPSKGGSSRSGPRLELVERHRRPVMDVLPVDGELALAPKYTIT